MKLQYGLSILLVLAAMIVSYFGFMLPFMGVVFLVFSVLKLVDLKGFVIIFESYDLIASHSRLYAYLYPFVELIIAGAFLFNVFVIPAAFISFFIMSLGSFGVVDKLLRRKNLKCACLGAKLRIPLTYFTLTENITMAVMSLIIIL